MRSKTQTNERQTTKLALRNQAGMGGRTEQRQATTAELLAGVEVSPEEAAQEELGEHQLVLFVMVHV